LFITLYWFMKLLTSYFKYLKPPKEEEPKYLTPQKSKIDGK